jgi:hypothetical protein
VKQISVVFALSAVLLGACERNGLAPEGRGLRLEATIGRSTIGVGDTTSIVFRLTNVGRETVALSFPDSCQVVPYITTARLTDVVYPSGGQWGCLTVITQLVLAPGAEHVIKVLVQGGTQPMNPAVSLVPGEYRAYARLDHPTLSLQSVPIAFRVN